MVTLHYITLHFYISYILFVFILFIKDNNTNEIGDERGRCRSMQEHLKLYTVHQKLLVGM